MDKSRKKWETIIMGRDGQRASSWKKALNCQIFIVGYLQSVERKHLHASAQCSTGYGTSTDRNRKQNSTSVLDGGDMRASRPRRLKVDGNSRSLLPTSTELQGINVCFHNTGTFTYFLPYLLTSFLTYFLPYLLTSLITYLLPSLLPYLLP